LIFSTDSATETNTKAELSQRWPRDAPYIYIYRLYGCPEKFPEFL